MIIEEPPALPAEPPAEPATEPLLGGGVVAWPLSAKTPEALKLQAGRLADWAAARPELAPGAVAAGLAARSGFAERAVVTGTSRAELLTGLGALAAGDPAGNLVSGSAVAAGKRKAVLVFPGQGGQWAGMGAGLWESCPAFRKQALACDEVFAPLLGWRVSDVLRGLAGSPPLERPDVVQPALFSVMVSLAAAWRAAGVIPAAVAGHSQGEIAAAYVAGVLTLADAALVVAARSRVLTALAGSGAMASVRASEEQAGELAGRWAGRLAVGVVNSPGSVVVSGEPAAVKELVAACAGEGLDARLLAVDYASHSPQVEEVQHELAAALGGVTPAAGSAPFYSGLTGALLDGTALDAGYWYDSLRGQVRFDAVVRSLAAAGHGAFIEVSPHPVLAVPAGEVLEDTGLSAAVTGTLRRGDGGPDRFAASVAAAWAAGLPVDWAAVAGPAVRAELPGYAFEHQRYWLPPGPGRDAGAAGLDDAGGHPLLGGVLELPDGSVAVTGRLSLAAQPWLADHTVHGAVMLPGAVFAELAGHAATLAGAAVVEGLTLLTPLVLPAVGAVQLQVLLGPADQEGRRSLTISARIAGPGGQWVRHAEATTASQAGHSPALPAGDWPPPGATPVPLAEGYERLAALGVRHGPAFQAVRAAWRRGEEVFAELSLDETAAVGFTLHPVLLDAALQSVGLAGGGGLREDAGGGLLVPFAWDGLVLAPGAAGTLRAVVAPAGPDAVSVTVTDAAGLVTAQVSTVRFRPVTAQQIAAAGSGTSGHELLALEWLPAQVPPGPGLPAGIKVTEVTADDGGVPLAVRRACARALELVQECLAGDGRLAVVTRGAVSVLPGEAVAAGRAGLAGAAVWGLVRSAQAEEPGRLVLVDTDGSPESAAVLDAAVGLGEPQVALRDGQVLVPRLARAGESGALVPPAGSGSWRLAVKTQGTLDGLVLADAPEGLAPLCPGQVRVAVRAAGVNFRDLVVALGMNPGLGTRIGDEGAGVVLEVASDVTGLAPGDRVLGLVPGGMLGPVAVADARLLAKAPRAWSFAQAASVPVAFLTAYYGLVDLGGLRAGERVLVHAGAGGVGMAAIQLARYRGAEVFATASPGKWGALRALGVAEDHIASSRSAGFEEAFRAVAGGRGVDVVLNSLTGELTDASLRLLGRGGRLMEMGKADIRDPEVVAA